MRLCRGNNVVLLGAMLLGIPSGAWANEIMVSMRSPSGDSENYLNVRGGVSGSTTSGRPTLCLELSPFGPMSVEACGIGAGFLHAGPGAELAHFRGKWSAYVWRLSNYELVVKPGLGVAGFPVSAEPSGLGSGGFGEGASAVFGPEASVSLQWTHNLFSGLELVGDLNVGLGWFQDAPELRTPRDSLAPFVDLTLGVGW